MVQRNERTPAPGYRPSNKIPKTITRQMVAFDEGAAKMMEPSNTMETTTAKNIHWSHSA